MNNQIEQTKKRGRPRKNVISQPTEESILQVKQAINELSKPIPNYVWFTETLDMKDDKYPKINIPYSQLFPEEDVKSLVKSLETERLEYEYFHLSKSKKRMKNNCLIVLAYLTGIYILSSSVGGSFNITEWSFRVIALFLFCVLLSFLVIAAIIIDGYYYRKNKEQIDFINDQLKK